MNEQVIKVWADRHVNEISKGLESVALKRTESVVPVLRKVLDAFSLEKIGTHHFSSLTGYGHGDEGRAVIDRVFARVLGAEKAAVRVQFVSGTHAIASALFGVLRPGDHLLTVTGKPYETLEEVIGLRGSGQGSLRDFGILYEEIALCEDGSVNFQELDKALAEPRRMVFVQRSCGYSWRKTLSIDEISQICKYVHKKQPDCICFVDNCYGELVEGREPCEVGADLIAGSLIKNLGGTLSPTGAYVAGRADLVEKACSRLTAPGIGSQGGTSFDLNRLILQGLFLSPQMVAEALIGADLVAGVFSSLGFSVLPEPGGVRGDLIQAVQLGDPDVLKVVCRSFQACSPVGSYLEPEPANMSGYECDLLMAGGTFIDGSTSELSADAPFKRPYILFVQGGTHRAHMKIALNRALFDLVTAGLLNLKQTV